VSTATMSQSIERGLSRRVQAQPGACISMATA
jgi:hypothetical protein